jgi:hypothetical protein
MPINAQIQKDGSLTFEDYRKPEPTYFPGATLMIPANGPWDTSMFAVIEQKDSDHPGMVAFVAKRIDTFDQAREVADYLWELAEEAGRVMDKYPRMSNGLTPNHVKGTFEWRADKLKVDAALEHSRTFNKWYVKYYKKEIYAYRQATRTRNLQR